MQLKLNVIRIDTIIFVGLSMSHWFGKLLTYITVDGGHSIECKLTPAFNWNMFCTLYAVILTFDLLT